MKKIAVFLADGFEEIEALTVVDVARRAKMQCDMISIENEEVVGAHNVVVKADKKISDEIKEYDMIVLPGGLPGADNLAKDKKVLELVKYFNNNNKYIAAICASPAMVLSAAGIEESRYITAYPGEDFENMLEKANYVEELVVVDSNLITSRGPATTLLFAYKIIDVLGGNSESLKEGMLWNLVEEEK
ncbi:MAG: DJ-1/PfpI family protein [Clostridia bacterium]|nr:DJ-1/PfpI family protein [Clostridia bacterium]